MPISKSRQIVCMFPVESITGKMSREKDKVSKKNPGFKVFVGYQNRYSVANRFQCKAKARSTQPDEAELQARSKFKEAVMQTNKIMFETPQELAKYMAAYQKNPEGYKTVRGYVFAKEYAKLSE